MKKTIYKGTAALLAVCMLLQINTVKAFSAETPAENREEETFLKAANPVTNYYNTDDRENRTILWAEGITPPQMGGENSDFQRIVTGENIEYIAKYAPGNGWYDVNKTKTQQIDASLCFEAAASNSLHWWLDRN